MNKSFEIRDGSPPEGVELLATTGLTYGAGQSLQERSRLGNVDYLIERTQTHTPGFQVPEGATAAYLGSRQAVPGDMYESQPVLWIRE